MVFVIGFICNFDRANISVCTTKILGDLQLTPIHIGMTTSAFSLAYAAFQIPGALWVQKNGTRLTIALAVAFWSLCTLLTGAATGFTFLIIARMLFGVGEAPAWPALNKHNFHWFPVKERGFANAIPNVGAHMSFLVAPPLIVWLLGLVSWRGVFYLSSALGFIGAGLWYWLTRNTPEEHPRINQEELSYITSGQDNAVKGSRVPWSKLFKFRSFWCIALTYFFSVYMYQYFVYWLPFYLQKQLHMSLKTMGFAATVPWLFALMGPIVVGRTSDWLVRRNSSLFVARNCLLILGFTGSAIALFISVFMTNAWYIVLLLGFALFFIGFNMTMPWAIASDIGGEYTGVISSWMNTWGQVGAATMATASAYIGTHYGWNATLIVLVIVAGCGIVSALAIRPEIKLT
jgi:ACS family glucarate transporter-like MFS transporter